MLSYFRRLVTSRVGAVIALVLVGLLAFAFAAGDVTGLRSGVGPLLGANVASIGSTTIGEQELSTSVRREVDAFRQQSPTLTMQQFITEGGMDGTLERMVNSYALEQFGKKYGMVASKDLIDSQIRAIPGLQDVSGKFSLQTYKQILAQRGMTDDQVRTQIGRDMLGQMLIAPTLGSSQVPVALAQPYAALLLEKRAGQIGYVPSVGMPAGPAPSDAEIAAFYKVNLNRYTLPERREIRYAMVTPDLFKDQTTPSDAEIAKAYDENKAKFAAGEKRSVTQVVLLDRSAANDVAAKVKGGTDLSTAAKAVGLEAARLDDVDRDAYAGDTGKELADQVFAAAKGAVVGPVKTDLGWTIVKLDAITKVPARSLDQVRPDLLKELTASKGLAALGKAHDALDDAIANTATFDELVKGQKLSAETTPALTAEGVDPLKPDLKPDPKLAPILQAGFGGEQGDDPVLVPTGDDNSFAVVALGRVLPAAPRPIGEIKDQVAKDLLAERARAAAREIAAGIAKKVSGGASMTAAFADTKLKTPPVQPLTATRAQLTANPQAGPPPPLALLFNLKTKQARILKGPGESGYFVVYLDRIEKGDATNKPSVVNAARADLGKIIGREYTQQFVAAVKKEIGVKTNADAIKRVKADLLGVAAGGAGGDDGQGGDPGNQ